MENTQDKTTVSYRKCKHITDSDHQIGTVSDLLVDVFVHHLTELSNAGFNFDRSRQISILRRSYFDCQRQISLPAPGFRSGQLIQKLPGIT